ncbi:MAG TPA: hypothetical protein VM821_04205 [Abditibacteriaceae bacterium]|nr:hypothetical protein [Abditibacteriaceae bacterium]
MRARNAGISWRDARDTCDNRVLDCRPAPAQVENKIKVRPRNAAQRLFQTVSTAAKQR